MPKRVARWTCLLAVWLGCQVPAHAVPPPQQPLEAAAAREVKSDPPGCLGASPVKQTLEGGLLGIVVGPVPEENPPVPARSYLFLLLDYPLTVCASAPDPAYEDVTRIKIANLSPSDFAYVMHTWGSDRIRITSTLETAATIYQEPGPVIFGYEFQFCWMPLAGGWQCMNSDEWAKRLPGPHLQWPP